ncbi:hypothetical protein MMC10_005627 [Thelotrema lepadinum]|nr:hypothetical protein [Thelotrema lepadinum]
MAPTDDRDSNSRKLCTDSFDNPITAFQRFVDEQISSMLQSITGLPSTLKQPGSWPRDVWRGQPAEPAENNGPRGEDAVAHFLNESEYSPFNIENDPDLKTFGPLWRQAFGDLMDATEGKRMASTTRDFNKAEWVAHYVPIWAKAVEEKAATYHPLSAVLSELSGATDPLEQLQFLQSTLADNFWMNDDDLDDEEEGEYDVETELDMYERMLGLGHNDTAESRSSAARPAPSSPREPASPVSPSSEPTTSVISTLTTTERVTMPDGSVRTKRVLKKRFADGREESNESEEVKQPQSKVSNQSPEDAWNRQTPLKEEQTRSEPEERKKGGWFWS